MNEEKGTAETEYKTLTLNIDYYQSFLDDVDIPDDQKRELIETLWVIMVQFVDMGFGIESSQIALASNSLNNTNLPLASQFERAGNISKEENLEKESIL